MRFIFTLLFFTVLILPVESDAQTTEVSVPVAVSDREGHYIDGLKKGDFTLFEDGVEQKITSFATYDEPINIALLLDTSVSTRETLENIKVAAKDFIGLLNSDDKCLIAAFDNRVNLLNSFTSSKETLKFSLDKLQTATQDGTVIYNAIDQTVQKSFNNVPGRKAIVILSDGKDLGSSVTRDRLISLLEESEVLIYTVFYKTGAGVNKLVMTPDGTVKVVKDDSQSAPKKKPQKKNNDYTVSIPLQVGLPVEGELEIIEQQADIAAIKSLKEISDTTTGRFYLSDTPKLRDVFKKVAGELRKQYRLSYRSKDSGNGTVVHNITVKVNRSDAVVRSRGKFRAKQL